jgi:para-aminobenzoate synthetase component 1
MKMSWEKRFVQDDVSVEWLQSLRLANVSIELVSPPNYRNHLSQGPWQFERLLGSGVHHELIGYTSADLVKLKDWLTTTTDLVLGWFSYELKDQLESLSSQNTERISFPIFYFFIPQHVAILRNERWKLHSYEQNIEKAYSLKSDVFLGNVYSSLSKEEYISKINLILEHIQLGDIYEANFCMEHFAENTQINPLRIFDEMVDGGKAPFSCRVSYYNRHLLCGSPERFMCKTNNRVISQPIKGTNRKLPNNDEALRDLEQNKKERSENIMITDLVRNDLSKHARKGSVRVDELCEVYPFAHVNQMISTVSCELSETSHPLDILLDSFPMGSMTGAPKIRAMRIIDELEGFGRGLFSGSVGYFTPDLDFDLNVVIRSILYDDATKILSFPSGGAITINSKPEEEYEECMLKAEAMHALIVNHVR